MWPRRKLLRRRWGLILAVLALLMFAPEMTEAQTQSSASGAVGLTAVVPADAPAEPPTILSPTNGTSSRESTVTVRGSCKTGLIVRVYRNDIFSGSGLCEGGAYSIIIDLFGGRNSLTAKSFDALDQSSPVSNTVDVQSVTDVEVAAPSKVILSSVFASRGSQSGNEFSWPFTLGGGTGPYAVTIDWGDDTIEPISVSFAGDFIAKHIYKLAGIYKVTVKAVDSRGATSYFQVVAVSSGEIKGAISAESNVNTAAPALRIIGGSLFYWWAFPMAFFAAASTFWLGKRHENHRLRRRIENGEQPFR
jgi:hypothetical protein